jgi:hypothetical protein
MAGLVSTMKRGMAASAIALAALVAVPVNADAGGLAAWRLFYQAHASGFFSSVAAISKTDAWAAGIPINGRVVLQPFLRHWNGQSWKAVSIPRAARFESQWVAASSAANVWVMGPSNGRVITRVYRFDGSRWHAIRVPAQIALTNPVVFGPRDVWAFGNENATSHDIFHWNGTRWVGYTVGVNLVQLSGTSDKDLWAVGLNRRRSFTGKIAAYRWTGARWRTVSMPHPASTALEDVQVVSTSDVWISGTVVNKTASPSFVLHWNGHTWSKVVAPASLPASSTDLLPDGTGGAWLGPEVHWTGHVWQGPVPVFAAGAGGSEGLMGRVPGTASFWLMTGTINNGSTVERPSIYLHGPVP